MRPVTGQTNLPSWIVTPPYPVPKQGLVVAGDRLVGVHQTADTSILYALDIYEAKTVFTSTPFGGLTTAPAVADGFIFFLQATSANPQAYTIGALSVADGTAPSTWVAPPPLRTDTTFPCSPDFLEWFWPR